MLYTLSTDDVWTKYSDAEIHGLIPHGTMLHLHAMLYRESERRKASLLLLACVRFGNNQKRTDRFIAGFSDHQYMVHVYQNTGREVTYIPTKLVLFLTDSI